MLRRTIAGVATGLLFTTTATAQFLSLPIELAENTGYYTSLAFDGVGAPHIVYFDEKSNDLVYTHRVGPSWQRQVIAHPGGTSPSVAIAPNGLIAASWYNPRDRLCMYSKLVDTTWVTMIVHPIPDNRGYENLNFTSTSDPRIALYESSRQRLYYAFLPGFSRDTVDKNGDAGYYVSMVHDASDTPHMVYFGRIGTGPWKLRHAVRLGVDIWAVTDIATTGQRGPTSLRIDASGNLHVSYFDQTSRQLVYGKRTGTTWAFQTLAAFANPTTGYNSLALDPGGLPAIAYYDPDLPSLRLTRFNGASWTVSDIDNSQLSGQYCSLAIGTGGNLAVSYNHNAGTITYPNGDLRFAESPGSGWTITNVDGVDGDDFGRFAALALEGSGFQPKWHIAYYDASNRWLRYQLYDEVVGALTPDYPDRSANTGQYADVASSSLTPGIAFMSYYDATNGDLKFVQGSQFNWTSVTVDASGDVGRYTSIALDATPQPHASYYDVTNGNLKYAFRDGSGWHVETADAPNDVGRFSSIALASGQPRIAYYDATNGDLRYAVKSGTWSSSPVFTTGDVGQHASLVLSAAGLPRIAAFDASNADLLYFFDNGGGWQMEIADASGDVGRFCSLDLASDGTPCIAYYDSTLRKLKYARREGGQWTHRVVEATETQPNGWYPSLALTTDDVPKIAYFNQTRQDLIAVYSGPITLDVPGTPVVGPAFRVHPNPLAANATVGGNGWVAHGQVEVEVYDLAGRRIAGAEVRVDFQGSWQVGWSGLVSRRLATGVYLVRAGAGGRHADQKVIVLQ